MAAIDLAAGRARVRQFLDAVDEDGNNDPRWTDANIDVALKNQMSTLLHDLATSGHERLSELVDVTTDANGVADLSSYDPVEVSGVGVRYGTSIAPASPVGNLSAHSPAGGATNIRVRLFRAWDISSTTTDPLFYFSGKTAKPTPLMESVLCKRAALEALIKEKETNPALESSLARDEATLLTSNQVKSVRFNRARGQSSANYFWDPDAQSITLVWRGGRRWFGPSI